MYRLMTSNSDIVMYCQLVSFCCFENLAHICETCCGFAVTWGLHCVALGLHLDKLKTLIDTVI